MPRRSTQSDNYRRLIERRLTELLVQSKSTSTPEHIKSIIYNESTKRASEYIADLIALFDSPQATIDLDILLPVLQDAWNYFPHRSLGGKCPAELFL
jgi:hypothetical protein